MNRWLTELGLAWRSGHIAALAPLLLLPVQKQSLLEVPIVVQVQAPSPAAVEAKLKEAIALQYAGRIADAEAAAREAVAAAAMLPRKTDTRVATAKTVLAGILSDRGAYQEAERLLKEAISTFDARLGPGNAMTTGTLGALGLLYYRQGRHQEAAAILQAAVGGMAKAYGKNSIDTIEMRNALASVLAALGRREEAVAEFQQVFDIAKRHGPKARDVAASAANNLGVMYNSMGKPAEAVTAYRQSYELNVAEFGADSPAAILNLVNAAVTYRDSGYPDQALPLFKQALDSREKSLGPDHPDTILVLNNIGWLELGQGDASAALSYLRPALAGYDRFRARQARGIRETGASVGERYVSRTVLGILKASAMQKAGSGIAPAAIAEAFEAAQRTHVTAAAASLARAGARFASDAGELGDTIRHGQDLLNRWRDLEAKRMASISSPPKMRNMQLEAALRDEQSAIDAQLDEIDHLLAARYPAYASLTDPSPVSVKDVQQLLQPDEALLLVSTFGGANGSGTFSWLVTRDDASMIGSDTSIGDVAMTVERLRCGLDPTVWTDATGRTACTRIGAQFDDQTGLPRFDAADAYALYQLLLEPLAAKLAGRRLIVVAPDPIASIPFQILLTAPPGSNPASLKDLAWLGKATPVSVLPSVQALRVLRGGAVRPAAPQPYVAFGDPVLSGNLECPQVIPTDDSCPDLSKGPQIALRGTRAARAPSASLTGIFKNSMVDVEAVRSLCPLPESATEIRCVAKSLKAAEADVHLGEAATIEAVRRADLERYRIVHFATHGLVAGDLASADGSLAEPALVLTPPSSARPDDDGLLKASDIVGLRLNADLVILSACNTAAGGVPGGEAMSGLASAFIYAGARSLLASNWPVESDAAVRITTGLVNELAAHPEIGRAEALRRATVQLLDDGDEADAHPAIWAPFSLIGEGGRTQP
ncbi:MAG: CHAT domain-containing tetratricopeptide repeat protein [Hyphomicrobiales bacterium]